MISFIRGTVADLTETSVIVESGYIGFEINMTGNALAQLHIGQEVKLYTYFQVREDAMVLYGFFSKDDLQVFRLLLGVNGVGQKQLLEFLPELRQTSFVSQFFPMTLRLFRRLPESGRRQPRS